MPSASALDRIEIGPARGSSGHRSPLQRDAPRRRLETSPGYPPSAPPARRHPPHPLPPSLYPRRRRPASSVPSSASARQVARWSPPCRTRLPVDPEQCLAFCSPALPAGPAHTARASEHGRFAAWAFRRVICRSAAAQQHRRCCRPRHQSACLPAPPSSSAGRRAPSVYRPKPTGNSNRCLLETRRYPSLRSLS